MVFRPDCEIATTTVKLRGLDPAKRYAISCEDGSASANSATGGELMEAGLPLKLGEMRSSDVVWLSAE